MIITCGIIVFTSVFCIKNSFDISIAEKTKQYGMLKSVGATKKQIRKNVFLKQQYLGLIGIPLGLLLGVFASSILILISNSFIGDMLAKGLKTCIIFFLDILCGCNRLRNYNNIIVCIKKCKKSFKKFLL